MSYNFMSNISNFSNVSSPNDAFDNISINSEIVFRDKRDIKHNASFLMIRAGYNSDLLIQLEPSGYCIYIPAGEMWSVDSIGEIEKIVIKKIFNPDSKALVSSGQIQWMMGYK